MSAIASHFFRQPHTKFHFDGRSARSAVMLGVLVVHCVVAYAFVHRTSTATLMTVPKPIEVEFIAERARVEAPHVVRPNIEQTNLAPPLAPTVEAYDAPAAAASSAVVPTPAASNQSVASTEIAAGPRVISDVEYVRPPRPQYPPAARAMRMRGVVILRVLIDVDGRAAQVALHRSSGYRVLDDAAQIAASTALYKPYVENGVAREAFVLVPIEFNASNS